MSNGLSVVDMINLPPVERRIMQLVMRSGSMTFPQLRDAIALMPAKDCPDEGKLHATLDYLMRERWLVRDASEQQTVYRVNEIRKPSAHNPNMWQKLESPEICVTPTQNTTSGGKRALPSKLWDCLLDDKEQ